MRSSFTYQTNLTKSTKSKKSCLFDYDVINFSLTPVPSGTVSDFWSLWSSSFLIFQLYSSHISCTVYPLYPCLSIRLSLSLSLYPSGLAKSPVTWKSPKKPGLFEKARALSWAFPNVVFFKNVMLEKKNAFINQVYFIVLWNMFWFCSWN